MSWRGEARESLIFLRLKVDMKNLPEARRIIREAYPFGERKYTPYKIWCQEVRKFFPDLYPRRKVNPALGQPLPWTEEKVCG